MALTNIALALFVVASVVSFIENNESRIGSVKKLFFNVCLLSAPFWLATIALLWTQDLKTGVSFVERSIPFLIVPLVVFIGRPIQNKTQIRKFVRIYIISSFILAVIILGHILFWYFLEKHLKVNKAFEDFIRESVEQIPVFNEHAIYLSLLLGSALLFLHHNKFNRRWLNVFISIVLLTTMVFLGSRGPIIALAIIFIGVTIFNKRLIKYKIFSLFGFLLLSLAIIYFSPIKNRMTQLMSTKHLYPQGEYFNSVNLRAAIYTCNFKIGSLEPMLGLGPGDVQQKLDECYQHNFKTTAFDKGIFNSHNQLLFYWVSYGIVGLLIILAIYFLLVSKALSRKQHLYLSFLIFVALCSLSENILNRNTGIMLFSIFNSFFYFSNYLKE